MAFNAGAIIGKVKLDTTDFKSGVKSLAKGAGQIALAVGAVAVGAMVKATYSANQWQKSLSNVNTLLDTNSTNSQKMAKSLLSLDSRLGSTLELTDAMYQAFSAGAKDMDQALNITQESAKFAKAGLTNISTAVDVLTTATNAYGSEVVSAEKASDIFFTTIKQGKINGEQLSSVIGQSIPLFASMNIPLEQLSSGLATMTKQGISASESTTQLNSIVNSFLKPTEALSQALEKQGFASGAALLESEGLTGALKFLEEQSGGSKAELSKLIANINGVKGVLALTGVGGVEFANVMKEMENATGATNTAFSKQELTFATFGNSMKKVELIAGNVGKYFANDIAIGLTKAADGMARFLTSTKGANAFSNVMATLAGGFALVRSVVEPLVNVILKEGSDLFKHIAGRTEGLTGNIDLLGIGLKILGGAMQVPLIAFKVLAGIIKYNIDNFFNIIDLVKAFGELVVKAFMLPIKTVGHFGDAIFNLVDTVKTSGKALGTIFDFIQGKATWKDVTKSIDVAREAFIDLGDKTKDIIREGVADFDDYNASMAKVGKAGIKLVSDAGGNLIDLGKDALTGVIEIFTKAESNADEINTNVQAAFKKTKEETLQNYDEMITGQKKYTEQSEDLNNDLIKSNEKTGEKAEEATTKTTKSLSDIWTNYTKDMKFTFSGMYDNIMAGAGALLSGMSTISEMETQNITDSIELTYTAQEDALQEKLDAGIISQEQYDSQLAIMEASKKAELNRAELDAFNSSKRFKKAEIWMNAAQSISSWWSTAGSLGPIAGPIFAGVMTGSTLAMSSKQLGLVNEQQFVPSRRSGGISSGVTRMNESGGEIVSLPDGSQVIPNDISRQIANNSNNQSSVININMSGFSVRSDSDIKNLANEVSKVLGKQLRSA